MHRSRAVCCSNANKERIMKKSNKKPAKEEDENEDREAS